MTLNRFRTLSMAAVLVCAATGAMAQSAGGGGGSGGGAGGAVDTHAIALPNPPTSRGEQAEAGAHHCRFELLRGHICDPRSTRR